MSAALDARIGTPLPDTLVYTCGPEGLLAAVEARCAAGRPARCTSSASRPRPPRVRSTPSSRSSWRAPASPSPCPPIARSSTPSQDHGISVLGSCHEGVCGTCETVILVDGEVDHRDSVLNDDEKASNETMMICVSRCTSGRLTLDL